MLQVTLLCGIVMAFAAPFYSQSTWDKLIDLSAIYRHVRPLVPNPTSPNIAAGLFGPMVPLACALIASQRRVGRIIGAFALGPLVLLQLRGALFAVAMGMVVYATLYWKWFLPRVPLTLLAGLVFNNATGEPVDIGAFVERNKTAPPRHFAPSGDLG